MPNELDPKTVFQFITGDFEKAWNAMAVADFDVHVGGNFLFAMQAMTLLELSCRVAILDPVIDRLAVFSGELEKLDPRYFTQLPGGPQDDPNGWRLPYLERTVTREQPRRWQLISVLYDLIRHGQAHRYQQASVRLSDGRSFNIALSGVPPCDAREGVRQWHPLGEDWVPGPGNAEHLMFQEDGDGDVWLRVRPDHLFLDFKCAAERAKIFECGLSPPPFLREGRSWSFSSKQLAATIAKSQHVFVRSGYDSSMRRS